MASKMAGTSKLKLEDNSSGEEYMGTAKPAAKKTTKPRKKPQYEDDFLSSEDEVKMPRRGQKLKKIKKRLQWADSSSEEDELPVAGNSHKKKKGKKNSDG